MDEKEIFAQVVAVFREEAVQLIGEIRATVELLPGTSDEEFLDELEKAMRLAHGLKGAAASVDFVDIENLAHALEDALVSGRSDRSIFTEAKINSIGEALRGMLLSVDGEDIAQLVPAYVGELTGSLEQGDTIPGQAAGVPLVAPESEQVRSLLPLSRAPRRFVEGDDSPEPHVDRTSAGGRFIRVEAERLDGLMRCVEKLQPSEYRSALILQELKELRNEAEFLFGDARNEKSDAFVGHLTRLLQRQYDRNVESQRALLELTESIKNVRMVRLHEGVSSWQRIVRDCERTLNKRVEFQVSVGELEVDKLVFDQLQEPLMHLIRNAVAHGLESSEERVAAGKSDVGQVTLTARLQGSMLQVSLSDDGRGVDAQRIGERALQQGLRTEQEIAQLDHSGLRALIFEQGFSTTIQANTVSGRGVGLHSARKQLGEIGGFISVGNRPINSGTCFTVTVPVSLVSQKGLFVRSGTSLVTLPIDDVSRVIALANSQISWEQAAGRVLVGRKNLPLLSLSVALGQERIEQEDVAYAVILESQGQSLGLVVEEVVGERTFVQRALPWDLQGSPGVSAAVVEASGSVALVLDPRHLRAQLAAGVYGRRPETFRERPRILVVDDTMTARVLAANMLKAAGFEVSMAQDGRQALELLKTQEFHLLLSDVEMPVMDGFELTRRVRADPRLKALPVLLVTTLAKDEYREAGIAAGADEYIVKGQLEARKIVDVVAHYLDFHHSSEA